MAPSRVTDLDILVIWKRMNVKRLRIRFVRPKIRVGPHVRISKEMMNFGKGGEQDFSTEIFTDCNGNREAASNRLRVGRFKSDSDWRPVLSGETDSFPRHEKYSLQDRWNIRWASQTRNSQRLASKISDNDPNQFYVNFLSNTSQNLYLANTIGEFTVDCCCLLNWVQATIGKWDYVRSHSFQTI